MNRGEQFTGYAMAVAAVGSAALINHAAGFIFGGEVHGFVIFALAVVLSSIVGGARAGLVATALSILTIDYYFLGELGFLRHSTGGLSQLALFAIQGVVISYTVGAMQAHKLERQKAYSELETQREERAKAYAEMETHRVERAKAYSELETHRVERAKAYSELETHRVERAKAYSLLESIEKAMRESEARYSVLFEASPVAVVVCDASGVIQDYNQCAVDYWGRSPVRGDPNERYGGALTLFNVDGTVLPLAESPMVGVLSTGVPAKNVEMLIERPDGSRLAVIVNFLPLKNERGEVTGAITSFDDITERHALELKLRKLSDRQEERAADSTVDLEAFCYSIAHDLRQHIRGVNANAQMLMQDLGENLGGDDRVSLERLSGAAVHMATMVEDMLRFAKVSAQELRRETVDMTHLAQEVAGLLGGENAVFKIEPGLTAEGDPSMLGLALQNLMENAVKFSKPGEKAVVEVGLDRSNGSGVFFVRDQGIGFDSKYVGKLFKPFERLHNHIPGTGLGLASVKRIVERHGGKVWAESEQNKGATFYMAL